MTIGYFFPRNLRSNAGFQYGYFDDFTVEKIPFHEAQIITTPDTFFCELPFELLIETSQRQAHYEWSTGETGPSITVTQPGIYTVATTVAGCLTYDTLRVEYIDPQSFSLGPDRLLCPDDFPEVLTAPTELFDFAWSTGAVGTTIQAPEPGMYHLSADTECGLLTDTIALALRHPDELLLVSFDTVCPSPDGYPLELPAGFDSYMIEGLSPQSHPDFVLSQAGSYPIAATSVCGTYLDTFQLEFRELLQPGLPTELSLCHPVDTVLRAASGYDSYRWSDGTLEPELRVVEYGEYRLVATGECQADTIDVVVAPPEPALFIDLPARLEVPLGEPTVLQAAIEGMGPFSYEWFPADSLSCAHCPQPVLQPLRREVFTVRVTDGFGCFAERTVEIDPYVQLDYFAPDAVSPNGDGINDRFEL